MDLKKLEKIKRSSRKIISCVILLLMAFFYFQFDTYRIPQNDFSLYPEYSPSQQLILDRFCFYHKGLWPVWKGDADSLQKYNWVIFQYSYHNQILTRPGKIMGKPGDKISIDSQGLQIGNQYYESLQNLWQYDIKAIPKGSYLMMHPHPEYGKILEVIPRENIVGKVVLSW